MNAIQGNVVKHVLTICPDIDQLIVNEEGISLSPDKSGLIREVYDQNGNSIVFPEMLSWYKEIESIVIASETGEKYQKDWQEYHKRGLELAHQLREWLSDDFDLWYEAPFEDKSGTIPHPILIMRTNKFCE